VSGAGVWDRIHGYLYAAFPYLYISVGTGEHRLAKPLMALFDLLERLGAKKNDGKPSAAVTFADTYHGKVVPLDGARQLVTVGRSIDLGDLEQVIPYATARELVLKNPERILAMDCPCRSARKNPCLPLGVCIIVGEPFASFVADHHPDKSRWLTQDQACRLLEDEERRGHVHHAFFKDAMLGRFYAICNCCSCCCGAMQATRHGVPMLAPSGYVSRIDPARCQGCGDCAQLCQFGALALVDGKAMVDAAKCMGCGVCSTRCENQAAALVRDTAKGEPLMVRRLVDEAQAG